MTRRELLQLLSVAALGRVQRALFLYHCHILEHEDMGMMRNYRIV